MPDRLIPDKRRNAPSWHLEVEHLENVIIYKSFLLERIFLKKMQEMVRSESCFGFHFFLHCVSNQKRNKIDPYLSNPCISFFY